MAKIKCPILPTDTGKTLIQEGISSIASSEARQVIRKLECTYCTYVYVYLGLI